MDLIYTNAKRIDQGVLSSYSFDLSYGADENDFELTLAADEPALEFGAIIYIEGTEYGGIIDAIKASSNGDTITYIGRTWHGILNSKAIEPDSGSNYFTVSGDANDILSTLVKRFKLGAIFTAGESTSAVNISSYKLARYTKAYDGIAAMLAKKKAKLIMTWKDRSVELTAVPIVDYTKAPVDGDVATLTVEKHDSKVNHLICFGRDCCANREVMHLYVDQFGRIGSVQYYTGLKEYTEVYEYGHADSETEIIEGARERFAKLRDNDKSEISLPAGDYTFDIGDIVGASEIRSGVSVTATVTQKIVRINNGTVSIEYKIGS